MKLHLKQVKIGKIQLFFGDSREIRGEEERKNGIIVFVKPEMEFKRYLNFKK